MKKFFNAKIYLLPNPLFIWGRKCIFMLETSRERVALLKAGMDGKTIEKLYVILNNFELVGCAPQKINCWEFL
ncbi:MAG: hypothetical protein PHH85_14580, partial [Candidatus Methanoperedens sp.]|nr:hypothetical protein [Candidatus Methanoperedens sp.]